MADPQTTLDDPRKGQASPPETGEMPQTHLKREDDRWMPRAAWRDWLILLVMMLIYAVWMGVIYWFEPGIR
jgi:hypothetical protein